MPRITSRRKQYKAKDIGAWIAGKMREARLTQEYMADKLGISQQAYGQKLRKSQFSYADLLTILQEIQASDEEIIKLMRV